MRNIAQIAGGLGVIGNLYRDVLLASGAIAAALFAGSYFLAH